MYIVLPGKNLLIIRGYKYHDSSVLLICLFKILFVTTVVLDISLLYLFIHIGNSQKKSSKIPRGATRNRISKHG